LGIKAKIISLIISLTLLITFVLSFIFFNEFNHFANKNIQTFNETILQTKKDELVNKMDLASHIIEMYYQKSTPQHMKQVVENRLIAKQEILFSQLNGIYQHFKQTNLPISKIKQILLLGISKTRYGKNGYFWVNDFGYKMIMHPIRPEYNNKTFINTPKVPFVELAVNALKNGKDSAFISYKFYNPATKRYEYKVSLVRVFKPFKWIIGTGAYVSDVTKLTQKQALEDIKNLRYGKNGYFWVNDFNYTMIMHPIKPEYNHKTFIHTPKVPFVELGVNALKNNAKEAFIEYKFYNPATHKYEDKLSLVRVFKPWGWIIGTGTYLDEIRSIKHDIKHQYKTTEFNIIKNTAVINLLILVVVILIGVYLTNIWIINPMKQLSDSKKHFGILSMRLIGII